MLSVQDRDVDVRLQLHRQAHQGLMAQIAKDTDLLERLHVMDYSLLLGVHFSSWGEDHWQAPSIPDQVTHPPTNRCQASSCAAVHLCNSIA